MVLFCAHCYNGLGSHKGCASLVSNYALKTFCVCQPLFQRGFCSTFSNSRGCQRCTWDWHQRRRQCDICHINPGRWIDVPAQPCELKKLAASPLSHRSYRLLQVHVSNKMHFVADPEILTESWACRVHMDTSIHLSGVCLGLCVSVCMCVCP